MRFDIIFISALTLIFSLSGVGYCSEKQIFSSSHVTGLPANSLPALVLTIGDGAEAVRIPAVLSSDNRLIILEMTSIGDLTNAQELFPESIREDGTFQAIDLTVDELQMLSPEPEMFGPAQLSANQAVPATRIPTLDDFLAVLNIMEDRKQQAVDIILEIKSIWQLPHEGADLNMVIERLVSNQALLFSDRTVYVAAYDPDELKKVRQLLDNLPASRLKIMQMVDTNNGNETMRLELGTWVPYNYDWIFTKFGMKAISQYADAIALPQTFFVDAVGTIINTSYIQDAHMLGLSVFINRYDESSLPPQQAFDLPDNQSFSEALLFSANIDGLISTNGRGPVLQRRLKEWQSRKSDLEEGKPVNTIERLLENFKHDSNSLQIQNNQPHAIQQ